MKKHDTKLLRHTNTHALLQQNLELYLFMTKNEILQLPFSL